MTDELPTLRDHFDNQLSTIRSLVEAAGAKQEANHHMQVAAIANVGRDLSEVKADVKAQGGRLTGVEVDVAYMKGQKSGSSGMYTALLAAVGAATGAAGVVLAIAMAGR